MSAEIIPLRRHDLDEGDAVRLRSGGPIMLVAIADAEIEQLVECIWVAGRRLASGKFHPKTLDVVARAAEGNAP